MNPKLDLPPLPGTLSLSAPDAALISATDTKNNSVLPPSPSSPRAVVTAASSETSDTSSNSSSSNGSINETAFPPPLTPLPRRAVSFDDSMLYTRSNYDLHSSAVRSAKMERNSPFGLHERLDQSTGSGSGSKKAVRLAPIPAFRRPTSQQDQQVPEQSPNHHNTLSSPSANINALSLSPVRNNENDNATLSITSKAITRLKQQSYGRLKDINFDLPTITEGVPAEEKSIHKMIVTKAPITVAKLEKRVRFGLVYVRTFPFILGDHPCCGKGAAPLAMGWDFQQKPNDDFGGSEFPLDKFEEMRFHTRRHGEKQLWISPFRRREILRKARYTEEEIDKAIEQAENIRRQRAATIKWSDFWMRLGGKPQDVTLHFNVDKLTQTSHAVQG